jgi:succinate dehydrogenase hydrophobic anchor subunit
MSETAIAVLLLLLLVAGSGAGLVCQDLLSEHHKSKETTESIRLVVTMLVTFTALVLGLLVTSVKADFDTHNGQYRAYGVALIRLDNRLREFGVQAEQVRKELRAFTASVILQSWPDEPPPTGDYTKTFSPLYAGSDETREITKQLANIDEEIHNLTPTGVFQVRINPIIEDHLRRLEDIRWALVEGSTSKVSAVFLAMLMFWLVTLFFIFGFIVPRNGLVYLAIFLTSISVASTLYLILDLDHAMSGFITVSSQPLRDAIVHMDQSAPPVAASTEVLP